MIGTTMNDTFASLQEQLKDVSVYQLHTEGVCPLVTEDCKVGSGSTWQKNVTLTLYLVSTF